MIHAAGNKLTNLIKGSAHEIINFGEMLIYFALKQCILERPPKIYHEDVKIKK